MTGLRKISMGDGCMLAVSYRPQPGKPVLIFSNSLGTDHRMWQPQIDALADEFSLLLYDTRGHGQSGCPQGAYSIDRLARDVVEMMDALDINSAHFCGLSLGGMTGQRLSWMAPERFLSFTLAATSAYMGPPSGWQERIDLVKTQGMAGLIDRIRSVWFTKKMQGENPKRIQQICDILVSTTAHGYAGCCAAIRDMDMRASAKLNKKSTLIIAGRDDAATPPDHGEFLHREMPQSELLLLDGAHLVNLQQAEAFSDAIRAFIQKVRQAS